MNRRTLLKGGALIGLAKIGDGKFPSPTAPCVRYVAECEPTHMKIEHCQPLIEFVEWIEATPGRRVVHTHEAAMELSYVVVEVDCTDRREAMLLAQRISGGAGSDVIRKRYGAICEVAYYEGER